MPRFPRPLKILATYVLGIAGGVGLLYGGRSAVNTLKGDPLAAFRAPKIAPYPDTLGLRLTNVRVRRYVGKRVETEFRVARVDIEKSRNVLAMVGIHDGVYRPATDKTGEGRFRFAAGEGSYNGYASTLNLSTRVTVRGKDYDLAANELAYNGLRKTLNVAGAVRGTAWGGKVRAENVAYDVARETFTSGPSMWQGKIPARYLALAGMPASFQNKSWNVESEFTKRIDKTHIEYTGALLSDDEVIIKAPKVLYDQTADTIVATGGVRYWSGRANFVGDKVTILRKEKRAILEGNVRMLVKPKSEEAAGPKIEEIPAYKALGPDQVTAGKELPKPTDVEVVRSGKSVRDFPLVVVGSKVDYVYAKGKRVAIITGSPQSRQELGSGAWRQVWTNTARYDAENEILRLNSTKGKRDARMKNSIGDDLVADWFELSTAEGDEDYSGAGIRGVVTTTDEDDAKGAKGGKPGGTAGPAGGPATGPGTGGGTGGGGTPPPPPPGRRR